MKLFTNHKIIKTDLGQLTLGDALAKLEQEAFFKEDTAFYPIKKMNEHHVILGVPRTRATPSQVHEFIYDKAAKNVEVNSKYDNLFFPYFILYLLPLQVMYKGGWELVMREWITFCLLILGITLFNLLVALIGLKSDAKAIERELAIRLNYLARNKR